MQTTINQNVPSIPANCDLLIPGHKVFWLKAIRLQERFVVPVTEVATSADSVTITIRGVARKFFTHDLGAINSILENFADRNWEISEKHGYLYARDNQGALVFSLATEPVGPCLRDLGIIRFG